MARGRLVASGLFARAMRESELRIWRQAIAHCHGNISDMAKWLSVSRAWIHARLKELHLDAEIKAARRN